MSAIAIHSRKKLGVSQRDNGWVGPLATMAATIAMAFVVALGVDFLPAGSQTAPAGAAEPAVVNVQPATVTPDSEVYDRSDILLAQG